MGTENRLSGDKGQYRETEQSPPFSVEVKTGIATRIIPILHTSSWRDA
jgi:hypothetical protein